MDPGDSEERVVTPSEIGWLERLRKRAWLAIMAVLVVGATAAFVALREPGPPPLTQRDVDARVTVGVNAQAEKEARAPAEGTVAYATIRPSLVLIKTRGSNAEGEFGGTGAGVIVNATGTVLTALHAAGYRMALLSNFTAPMLDRAVARSGLQGLFEPHLTTDLVQVYKPDARAYRMALGAFGLPREQVAFVAFAGWDVAGAAAFGFPTYWANRAHAQPDELGVGADAMAPGLEGLPAFVGMG